jgi:hypothetical protein
VWRPGDVVLLRSIYGGRVRWTFPHRYVADDGGRHVFYLEPGAEGMLMGRDTDGRYLERWARGDDPQRHVWERLRVLRLVRPGDAHTVECCWEDDWRFVGWYLNLQAPLRGSALGFDTTDWALDIVVEPDGEWRWKDEADFAEARALGVFTAAEAEAVRAEGERVLAERPWPTGWEDWRPPPEWTPPQLPEGWDVV